MWKENKSKILEPSQSRKSGLEVLVRGAVKTILNNWALTFDPGK